MGWCISVPTEHPFELHPELPLYKLPHLLFILKQYGTNNQISITYIPYNTYHTKVQPALKFGAIVRLVVVCPIMSNLNHLTLEGDTTRSHHYKLWL